MQPSHLLKVRKPAVAGMFYYIDPKHLQIQVDDMFSDTTKRNLYPLVVSPHAGYQYSGETAAHAISGLKIKKTYVILGPNHTGIGSDFSIMSSGSWETPLGKCKIGKKIAEKMMECQFLEEDPLAHSQEHSIEVQLPLLQKRFNNKFSFVPVCIKNTGYGDKFLEKCVSLGKIIAGIMKKRSVGVIASSDFSHYLPSEFADKKDQAAIENIMNLDLEGFFQTLKEVDASICGFGSIAVVIAVAKELGLAPRLITKSSSGDVTGDYNNVVTYYAIGFE